jgi:hypothetical protein
MRWSWLLLVTLVFRPVSACLNMTERIPGVAIEDVEFYRLGEVEVDTDSLASFIRTKEQACGDKLDRGCNDLVIGWLFQKNFKKALDLSTRLVAKFPDKYSVVITHAAALELNGKPSEAIPFMKHALELEPTSHKGSEWIHLNFLQQRVQGDAGTDPWKLIGVDLRPNGVLQRPAGTDMVALVKQVHYQVNDRLYFTPTDDRLFGALMSAYADLLELNGYKSQAARMRERSVSYGFIHAKDTEVGERSSPSDQETIEQSPDPIASPVVVAEEEDLSKASLYSWLLIGAVVLGIGGFIWRNSLT